MIEIDSYVYPPKLYPLVLGFTVVLYSCPNRLASELKYTRGKFPEYYNRTRQAAKINAKWQTQMGDWFGAIDWSGATVLREATDRLDLYGCALAAVPDLEALSESLRQVRAVFAMQTGQEFHAHGLAEDVQLAVLQEAISHGLRIAAIRCDKKALHQQMRLPKPGDLASSIALVLLEQCLPFMNLASLVFDEDIQREQRRRAFMTEVRRVARTGPNPARLRTRFVRSRSHDLAQVADVVVYNVVRDAHQAIRLPELQECIRRLLIAEGTILIDLPGE